MMDFERKHYTSPVWRDWSHWSQFFEKCFKFSGNLLSPYICFGVLQSVHFDPPWSDRWVGFLVWTVTLYRNQMQSRSSHLKTQHMKLRKDLSDTGAAPPKLKLKNIPGEDEDEMINIWAINMEIPTEISAWKYVKEESCYYIWRW